MQLKMISSPHCAVSFPLMFINIIINLTRWNANRCFSFTSHTFFLGLSWIPFSTASFTYVEGKFVVVHRGTYNNNVAKLFHPVICERTEHKASTDSHPYGGCFEILNLLHVRSCERFTFCDVLHDAKQKTWTTSREGAVQTGKLSTLMLLVFTRKKGLP